MKIHLNYKQLKGILSNYINVDIANIVIEYYDSLLIDMLEQAKNTPPLYIPLLYPDWNCMLPIVGLNLMDIIINLKK